MAQESNSVVMGVDVAWDPEERSFVPVFLTEYGFSHGPVKAAKVAGTWRAVVQRGS